ncbi:cytochrome c [Pandoraea nosoerga]|nr:cytochrome c [Pandoraea nosoerga]MBN4674514.1 cytochrome c [Pandoraea nosoerga]MBN4679782.1 cytochrome c [Pandoraea nosoerga]MBN4743130.1 cytochrome c [Pandoraea nosoerga]
MKPTPRLRAGRRACVARVALSLALFAMGGAALAGQAASAPADNATLARGKYLAIAGDCAACHTAPAGKPFAGGYSLESPLGAIYATNITPSKQAGIGNYTEAQFARAVREGVRADGQHLYPAMPYTSYAKVSDEDIHALYVYFMHGVEPVDVRAAQTQLAFPFSMRSTLAAWNVLFLDRERFRPDPSKSEQVNRGNYLVNGLAHCGACHTPRSAFMNEMSSKALSGAQVGPRFAPDITSGDSGIGRWRDEALVEYLRTGRLAGKANAAGPMAEAVQNSLQYLTDADLHAIVAYLRTVPSVSPQAAPQTAAFSLGGPYSDEARQRGAEKSNSHDAIRGGARLFSAYCASCHRPDGGGSRDGQYPALYHNTTTGHPDPTNVVATILNGVTRTVGGKTVAMPRFDEKSVVASLSDEDIAAITNYVTAHYGNPKAQPVSAERVSALRHGGPRPLIARLPPAAWVTALALALAIMLAAVAFIVRRRHSRTPPPRPPAPSGSR